MPPVGDITIHESQLLGAYGALSALCFLYYNIVIPILHEFYKYLAKFDLHLLLFTGSVPRGVFCEQSSQKAREPRREIMRKHDFCASRSVLLAME